MLNTVSNKSKWTIFGSLIVFALIIASPQIYAAVEPHIIMTLDAGQTTDAMTILNNAGDEVFKIDHEGLLQNGGGGIYTITMDGGTAIELVNATDTISNPIVLGSFIKFIVPITNVGANGHYPYFSSWIQTETIQDIGAASIVVQLEASRDDITWTAVDQCFDNTAIWSYCSDQYEGFWNDGYGYYRFVAYNSDGATSGALQYYKGFAEINVPAGWTVDDTWDGT